MTIADLMGAPSYEEHPGFNPQYYADERTAQELARIFGGEVRRTGDYSGGPFDIPGHWQVVVNGVPFNAALLYNMFRNDINLGLGQLADLFAQRGLEYRPGGELAGYEVPRWGPVQRVTDATGKPVGPETAVGPWSTAAAPELEEQRRGPRTGSRGAETPFYWPDQNQKAMEALKLLAPLFQQPRGTSAIGGYAAPVVGSNAPLQSQFALF